MKQPPRIARWILSVTNRKSNRESILGDFAEFYDEIHVMHGSFRALLWIYKEILKSIPQFIISSIYWGVIMFTNYFKMAYRNIKKQQTYSLINFSGLSVGLTMIILVLLFVQYETSYDSYNDNAERIYRVVCENQKLNNTWYITPAPLAEKLMEDFPEVEAATRIRGSGNPHISYKDKNFFEDKFTFADSNLFDIFSLHLIIGDKRSALNEPFSIIISESTANKYFGQENPIGKVITYQDNYDFTVTGVMKDMPKNTHIVMDFIASFNTLEKMYSWMRSNNWDGFMYYTYILLNKDVNPKSIEEKISSLMKSNVSIDAVQQFIFLLQPLREIYLYPDRIITVYIFISIAILILTLACVNYMNLTTAQSIHRMKEIVIRKIVGARRTQLMKQLLCESTVFTLISFSIAIILVPVTLPAFNDVIEGNLQFNLIDNNEFLLWLLVLVLSVGIISGSLPALLISSTRPLLMIQNLSSSLRKSTFRNILVVTQFTISIILIIVTLTINEQLNFIRNSDVGFRKEQIVVIDIDNRNIKSNIATIQNELNSYTNIKSTSSLMSLPNEIDMKSKVVWPGKTDNVETHISLNYVDYNYIDLFEIPIVDGRNFSKNYISDTSGTFILNEKAVQMLGWKSPIGKELTHWGLGESTGKVVGVVKDFHMNSFHNFIEPLCIELNPESADMNLAVKISGIQISETISFIKETLANYSPNYPFEYHFFDEIYHQTYKSEQNMGKILSLFSMLALFIGCLGLFGLVTFTSERRIKEIGIRKILGAQVSGITLMLSKEFMKLILISNIIAFPFAFYFINKWLQDFAYKVDINPWIFLISGIFTFIIAIITVSFHSIKAAHTNPIDTLKYE